MRDPLDYSDQFNTVLSPKREKDYQEWLKKLPPQQRSTYDYDMRGAFDAGVGQTKNGHFPDTFKKPNHPSFSDQSNYHGIEGNEGGSWTKTPDGWSFKPGPTNLKLHGHEGLQKYFEKTDPEVDLILPFRKPGDSSSNEKEDIPERYKAVPDLSKGDIVTRADDAPLVGISPSDIQRGPWAAGQPKKFSYPVSPYTNPFTTPEYGIQSSPSNPVISDRPPEIPPGFSDTRGESSRYRPGVDPVAPQGGFTKIADVKTTQALPTAPFDPWDSGRSMAPADIAPLTDVSQGVRDYARDVVTGEVARRGLEYYNQHPGEAALALSGGGLSVKGAGPNVIPLSRPRTYEAAQGDARSAMAEPRGYALDIGPKGAEMAPFGDVPAHTMSQPGSQPGPPPRPGEALPEGTALKPLEPTNTNAPTYPISGGYRLMPAFTKKDQWSIIDPRGEIMFRSPDKATAQKIFDYVNKGTTGLAVGGLAAGGALTGSPAEAAPSENYMKVLGEAQAPYPKDVQDFYDMVRANDRYRYEEVHDDPFNRPPQYVPVQYNPYAAALEDIQPQGIPTVPTGTWSFGDTQAAPLAQPSRFPGFSDIDALNYYRPMSNLNGVPTYGG